MKINQIIFKKHLQTCIVFINIEKENKINKIIIKKGGGNVGL